MLFRSILKKKHLLKERLLGLIEGSNNFNDVTEYYLVGLQEELNLIDDNDLPHRVKKVAINESDGFIYDDKIFLIPIYQY